MVRTPSTAGSCSLILSPVSRGRSDVVLRGLAREIAGILRRQWLPALLPAAALGAGAGAIVLVRHEIGAEIVLGILLAVAFELYVAWAELIVAADRGEDRPATTGVMVRRATAVLPALLLASFVAVSVPLAASGLLVLPGLWLLTRWSLFAPAIVHEGLGWRAALARSNALVRGAFWAVALAVTGSVVIEHAVIHAAAHTLEPAHGTAGTGLIVAAVTAMAVSPAAAFTISLVYERLLAATPDPSAPTAPARVHAEPASGGLHPRR
jgi:hypothetical protein